jgi:hypothetical protein
MAVSGAHVPAGRFSIAESVWIELAALIFSGQPASVALSPCVDPKTGCLRVLHNRRVRGFTAAFLFTTTQVMAVNMRKISAWMERGVSVDSRGRGPEKPKRNTRRRDRTYGRENPPAWRGLKPLPEPAGT